MDVDDNDEHVDAELGYGTRYSSLDDGASLHQNENKIHLGILLSNALTYCTILTYAEVAEDF